MIDCNVGDVGLVRRLAVFDTQDTGGAEDFVCKFQPALLYQGEYGDGSDWLGHGRNAEERVLIGPDEMLAIRHPYRFIIDELAIREIAIEMAGTRNCCRN
jgi:hypothetical protein